MLRPGVLLWFQVMDSITERFSWGGERKEGRKSLERENSQVAAFLGLWISSKVPWCSGGLSAHDESTGLLHCLLYFAILYDSHIFWVVLICDQYFIATPRGICSENTGKKQRPDARLRMSNCHQTMASVIHPALAEYSQLQYVFTFQNDKAKVKASLSCSLPFPFTSHISSAGYRTAGKGHSLPQPGRKALWLKR